MSIEVMSRVWKLARHKGGTLIALLALADFANDQGICWPNITTLAKKARLTERQTETVLNALEKSGDIVRLSGGGRGKSNHYAVLTGLSDSEQETLKTFLGNNFTEIKTVKNTTRNPEISSRKTLKFPAENQGLSEASQSPKPPIEGGGNHHGNHHEPPPPPTPRTESTDGGGGGKLNHSPEPEPKQELPQALTAAREKTKAAGPGRTVVSYTDTEKWLAAEGCGTAHKWRDLPLDAVQQDVVRRKAQGQGWGAISNAWGAAPPGSAAPPRASPPPRRAETPEEHEDRMRRIRQRYQQGT